MSDSRPLQIVVDHPLTDTFPYGQFEGRCRFETAADMDEVTRLVREADVLYGARVPDIVPAETPRLRWIQVPSAGVNYLRNLPVWTSNVLITSSRGVHAVAMSEQVFALLLALSRGVPRMVRAQERHEWIQSDIHPLELRGKTMGIVGWGKVGDAVAHLAHAFGMRVIGIRHSVKEPQERASSCGAFDNPPQIAPVDLPPDMVFPMSDLHRVLGESDVVVLILPLTADTEGVIDRQALAAMKTGSLLINIGRGQVVDETALIEALQSGHVRGAGLDVFDEEPLPPQSPFWDMPNVLVAPHTGGAGEHTDTRASHLFAVNLERYLAKQPLLNVVDRMQQY